MDRDVDEVVSSGERLVDGVVDHLVDEVMQAARARRPDVHPGPQTDRLEALEDGDVFCGVGCFGHQKSPANSHIAGPGKCIRTRGRTGPSAGSLERLVATSSRSSGSSIAAAAESASAPISAGTSGASRTGGSELESYPGFRDGTDGAPHPGRRVGAEPRRPAARGSRPRGSRARSPRSTTTSRRAASRRERSSAATPGARSRRRRRPARRRSGRPAESRRGCLRARARARPRVRCAPSATPDPGRPREPAPARPEARLVEVAVITVCEPRSIIRASARRRSPSSSESTSSRRTSGDTSWRSRSAAASASTSARTAIRCSPWEPNTRRSRFAASIRTS